MLRSLYLLFALMLLPLGTVRAQNSIDQLMEQYSATGNVAYTSIVKRDPQTHKVARVVNFLELRDQSNAPFVKAFQAETDKCNSTQTSMNNGWKTTILRFNTQQKQHVYMLEYRAEPYQRTGGTVTVIVKQL